MQLHRPVLCIILVALTRSSLTMLASPSGGNVKSPVILVPGDGGSQLWARLNATQSPWFCQRFTKPHQPMLLWLQLSNLVYPAIKCLAYNLMLKQRRESRQPMLDFPSPTEDNIGVHAFVPGFGTVDTMLWIGDWQSKYTAYYSTLVDHLERHQGYARNVSIRGAPYDFRKAPNEFGDYFQQVKAIIEDSYEKSGGQRVVLVAHSMGCKLMLHFLQHQSQQWKDEHILHFVAAGGAFGGVASSLLAMVSGYSIGIPLVKPLWFRPVQRSWPSTHYLLPNPAVFSATRPLVTDPSGTRYTVANLSALLSHIQPRSLAGSRAFQHLTDISRPPGVATSCVFGTGLATPAGFRWHSGDNFPDGQPSRVDFESGDGTVGMATGRICRHWAARQKEKVRIAHLHGAQHMALLTDARFLDVVAAVASAGDRR